jgi:hypothetical protein
MTETATICVRCRGTHWVCESLGGCSWRKASLILRRASASRTWGPWIDDDYDRTNFSTTC